MGNENKKKDANKPVLPNQAMLFLRGAIGFYLMYLAYELILRNYFLILLIVFCKTLMK